MKLILRSSLFLLFALSFSFCSAKDQLIDSIKAYIKHQHIKFPEIVLKQAILETGWFKSPFLMKRNNLFGFRINHKYLRFKDWKSSIDYYKDWQEEKYTNTSEDYYQFLVRIKYAASENYVKTLKKIKTQK